ncbi:hypothetical protein ES706_01846 [subsurface metagenome]
MLNSQKFPIALSLDRFQEEIPKDYIHRGFRQGLPLAMQFNHLLNVFQNKTKKLK